MGFHFPSTVETSDAGLVSPRLAFFHLLFQTNTGRWITIIHPVWYRVITVGMSGRIWVHFLPVLDDQEGRSGFNVRNATHG